MERQQKKATKQPKTSKKASQPNSGKAEEESTSVLERRKLALEIRKLEIDNHRPWQIAKTVIAWAGIVIPIWISMCSYQRATDDKRTALIAAAAAKLNGDRPEVGAHELSLYPLDKVLPYLVYAVSSSSEDVDLRRSHVAVETLRNLSLRCLPTALKVHLETQGGGITGRIEVLDTRSAALNLTQPEIKLKERLSEVETSLAAVRSLKSCGR